VIARLPCLPAGRRQAGILVIGDLMQRIHPSWLTVKLSANSSFCGIQALNRRLGLNTVCESAACPNISACWNKTEVTYLLLGKDCTRACRFCNVSKDNPQLPNPLEPQSIAQAVKELGFTYIVLTSVTRDDLPDRGAAHFLETFSYVHNLCLETQIELLIPDFGMRNDLLERIASCGACVIGHNLETVKSLYPVLRQKSSYQTSLAVLKSLKRQNLSLITKSAILLGLGEREPELIEAIKDLKAASVDILYLGQYLSPTKNHWPVQKFYTPEEFKYFKDIALELGFKAVVSEPLARSSWHAYQAYVDSQMTTDKRTD
jgi:lipoic acid synthetase